MVFSADKFMSASTREALEALNKSELLLLGKYINLEVKTAI